MATACSAVGGAVRGSSNYLLKSAIWVTIYPRGNELIICGTLKDGVREEFVDPEIVRDMLKNTRSRFSPGTLLGQ